ncbi:hypothetical protein SAMD00019534_084940 [Acytostelium subglobosum LB1]|uniref:hypothetical protein n=1 Tax=Acytostelium subglobosum LB1 TaxID=1410327 RepID=UPI0006447E0A|nr:hypothetical protein SAMD00019534_084940 [Acytostelium subglobosum LB1]GAM25319.1 hypothetical protein SAMD00019534_084940 [Acytostelium subglobosum LB1]|eukprot:XP_012751839.1 hypothetical protein SAMD00019534_084940 [Acytostelium subglobosum LB1]
MLSFRHIISRQTLPRSLSTSSSLYRYSTATTSTSTPNDVDPHGVVVGCFEDAQEFSALGKEINEQTDNHLTKSLKLANQTGKLGDSLVLYNVSPKYPRVAIVGLGKRAPSPQDSAAPTYNKFENSRRAAGAGVKSLKARGATKIAVDTSIGDIRALSEGANLSVFKFSLKTQSNKSNGNGNGNGNDNTPVDIKPYESSETQPEKAWEDGKVLAEAQNFARTLADMPSNLMTPTIFVETVREKLKDLIAAGKVEMIVRDRQWAEEQKMGMFLGVAVGSDQPPLFLELHYRGAQNKDAKPLVYVGKGVTFDSGGISIKPSAGMGLMRGDMQGAATAVGAMYGVASLGLDANLTVLTPLTENMPSGKATKPGDVLTAANGKTVEIDNTDAEGRLILGDALHYAHKFNPAAIVDIATLTGAIDVALGFHHTGCFSSSDALWNDIDQCGQTAGERMWRMPLLPEYRKQLDSKIADIVNSGSRSAGSCTAAMFLKEFVQIEKWAHLDIAGVMYSNEEGPYIGKGMTGKPVRTLIELARKQH